VLDIVTWPHSASTSAGHVAAIAVPGLFDRVEPLAHPDSVHLTVATVRYTIADRVHGGVASTFLAERAANLQVQLRPTITSGCGRRCPGHHDGPGTGIAPFRAFCRSAGPPPQRTQLLFFGDRRRATDYLYARSCRPIWNPAY
jgi:sulfite reductase (NADPH) flavoprotein alpha-component